MLEACGTTYLRRVFRGHEADEVDDTVGVTGLVVVP